MILVRPAAKEDLPAIAALHASQGLDYEAPDWSKMLVSVVIEVDGQITMAAFLRKTAETYLLLDPRAETSKKERLGQLLILHKELVAPCEGNGLSDLHCWLPPALDTQFGKLLMHLGWTKPLWPCYSREVK